MSYVVPPRRPRRGHTYALVTAPFDGWVKIGRTGPGVDPVTRLKSCQTGNARRLDLRAVWPIDAEAVLHEHYEAFRGQGEWFALPSAFVACMARVAGMKDPVGDLFSVWSARKVWEAAGGRRVARGPETLARIFMTATAADERDERRLGVDEHRVQWQPDQRDRALLAQGQPMEITLIGEIVDCAVVAPVAELGLRLVRKNDGR